MAHVLDGVDAEVRQLVGAEFRARGGSWANLERFGKSAAELDRLAHAMTAVEDRLEVEHGERGDWPARRSGLRRARRRVEGTLT